MGPFAGTCKKQRKTLATLELLKITLRVLLPDSSAPADSKCIMLEQKARPSVAARRGVSLFSFSIFISAFLVICVAFVTGTRETEAICLVDTFRKAVLVVEATCLTSCCPTHHVGSAQTQGDFRTTTL